MSTVSLFTVTHDTHWSRSGGPLVSKEQITFSPFKNKILVLVDGIIVCSPYLENDVHS